MALPRALVALAALLAVAALAVAGAVVPDIAPGGAGPPASDETAPTDTPDLREGGARGDDTTDDGTGTAAAASTESPTGTPAVGRGDVPVGRVLAVALAGLLLGGLALFVGLRGDDGRGTPTVAERDPTATTDGRSPAPEDGVARAWHRMVDRLDVPDRETRTPGELARRAVDAGMDPGAVRELTDLFRAVRYGDERATPERERRADRALEALEDR